VVGYQSFWGFCCL